MDRDNEFLKDCISTSLIILMQEKHFDDISITEITQKAGVSRMSYYRNFIQKEDILDQHMQSLFTEYMNQRHKYGEDAYSRFLVGYEFFKENKDFIIALEKSNLSGIALNKLNEFMKDYYVDDLNNTTHVYKFYNYFGAMYNSAKMWILNGLNESPEELAKIFVDTFSIK